MGLSLCLFLGSSFFPFQQYLVDLIFTLGSNSNETTITQDSTSEATPNKAVGVCSFGSDTAVIPTGLATKTPRESAHTHVF